MSERPTAAVALAVAENAHAKIDTHEEICAIRYEALNSSIDELKGAMTNQGRVAWGIMIAICAWMAVQLWDGRNSEPHRPPAPVSPMAFVK
jgi:hypothetical protein